MNRKTLKDRFYETSKFIRVACLFLLLLTILLPVVLSWYQYSVWELILAMILFDICIYPTIRYIGKREAGLPVMPVLCLAFGVQYAIPILTQDAKMEVVNDVVYLNHDVVVMALLISIVGILCLQGAYWLVRKGRITRMMPAIVLNLTDTRAEIFCVVAFLLAFTAGRMQTLLSKETALQFSAFFNLLQNQVLVAIGLLTWLVYSRGKRGRQLFMLYGLVAFASMRGFSTTMLEAIVLPIAVLFIGKWTFTRKLPVAGLAAIALTILFFTPAKMEIRRGALADVEAGRATSSVSRAVDWLNRAADFWAGTLSGRRSLVDSTNDASSRTDLIHQFAYMMEMTPSVIPYSRGTDYYYLLVSPIPRAVWPQKPAATESAVRFEIEYGLVTEEVAEGTMVGPTLIGEGYVNFGLAGALLIMIFQGAVMGLFQQVFASRSPGGVAVFLAIFVFFLNGQGSSLAVMFGGILQSLVVGCVLLWLFSGRLKLPFSRSVERNSNLQTLRS